MRIGHYSNAAALPGGTATYVLTLLKAQQAHGHEVVLYLNAPPKAFATLDFRVCAVRDETELYAQAQRDRLDCLHLHENIDSLPEARLPLVLTAHGHGFVCLSGTLFLKSSMRPCPHTYSPVLCTLNHLTERCGSVRPQRLAREFLRLRGERNNFPKMDIIVPSNYFFQLYLRAGFTRNRLHLVPHFVDPNILSLPINQDNVGLRFLFSGRLEQNRGMLPLLRAMTLLPKVVHLDVAGDGTSAVHDREMARNLGLSHRVQFHGWCNREQLTELYKTSLGLVMPSLTHETFGLAAAEAQAHGRAVIASAVGGLEDIVENEVTGFLVYPGDIEGLAAAMRKLILERGLSQKMGMNGAKRMHEKFSLPLHLQALDDVYGRAAERDTVEPYSVDPVAPAASAAR